MLEIMIETAEKVDSDVTISDVCAPVEEVQADAMEEVKIEEQAAEVPEGEAEKADKAQHKKPKRKKSAAQYEKEDASMVKELLNLWDSGKTPTQSYMRRKWRIGSARLGSIWQRAT